MTDAPPPYPGINGYNGYAAAGGGPPLGAAASPSAPPQGFASPHDAKAAEAAGSAAQNPQQGWYDPNNPHTAYLPQTGDFPPSYDDSQKKKDS